MAPQTLLSSSPADGARSGSVPCLEHVDRQHAQPNVLHAPNRRLCDAHSDDFLKNLLDSEDHHDLSIEPQMSLMPTTQAVSDGDWKNEQREPLDWVHSDRLRHQPLLCKMEDAEGEVTLEDFVRKTGICKEDGRLNYVSPVLSNSTTAGLDLCSPVAGPDLAASTAENTIPDIQLDWMKFVNRQTEHLMQQTLVKNELPSSFLGGGANIYDNFGDSPNYCPNNLSQEFSFPFPNLVETPYISEFGMPCKKRPAAESVIEKIVERRQRRMIKNRESAARSRARKQAYTFELEAEVTYLKEENTRLRQEQASRVQPLGSCESKIQVLRRTRTW